MLTTIADIRCSRVGPVAKKAASVSNVMLIVAPRNGGCPTDLLAFQLRDDVSHVPQQACHPGDGRLAFGGGGVQGTICESKIDQDGTGAVIAIPNDYRLKPVTIVPWLALFACLTSVYIYTTIGTYTNKDGYIYRCTS